MKRSELNVRDVFILLEGDTYYMYGTDLPVNGQWHPGFPVYTSKDLEEWEGPRDAFCPDETFWAHKDYWAPEVHEYKGSYYLFGTVRSETRNRGTQIFRSHRPDGPFHPISDGPVTPAEWLCLDGTLVLDKQGKPYMVFCHEWLQTVDGEICLMPLTDDLTAPAGEPMVLFRASSAPGVRTADWENGKFIGYVTDGPFPYETKDGQLLLLWSSFSQGGYTIYCARSASGELTGPWVQDPEPIYSGDGGHSMLFRKKDGSLWISFHSPNEGGKERAIFLPMEERDNSLYLVK